MNKFKKKWKSEYLKQTMFLILLPQVFTQGDATATTQTPFPQNSGRQAIWQRRDTQLPDNRDSTRQTWNRNMNRDIPWEQEQLLPFQGYQGQGRNQGKFSESRSFLQYYPDALENRTYLPSHPDIGRGGPMQQTNTKLDIEAIQREMMNKKMSLRESHPSVPRQDQGTTGNGSLQRADNSDRNQTAGNYTGPYYRNGGPTTVPPYWYDRNYRGSYQGGYGPGGPRDWHGRQGSGNGPPMRSNSRYGPPTYPPPTFPSGRGRGGRNWEGPYDQRRGYGYYNGGGGRNYNGPGGNHGGSGTGGHINQGSGAGGSGHLLMVDPDLPDGLDDHWQRMQKYKAWQIMNKEMGGGPGRGPTFQPFVNYGRWQGRPYPTGPTNPSWPNMDRRKDMGNRQPPWGNGQSGSGRSQMWKNEGQWSPGQQNLTGQSNVNVSRSSNITGNARHSLREFNRQDVIQQPARSRDQTPRGSTTRGSMPPPPPPPPRDLFVNNPYRPQQPISRQETLGPDYRKDRWEYRMRQAQLERQQNKNGPQQYPPFYGRPDSPQEAKKEWENEQQEARGQPLWPNTPGPTPRDMTIQSRSGVNIPQGNQGMRQPTLKMSDLSPSLATIVGNVTQSIQQQTNETYFQNSGRFSPTREFSQPTEMTHTFPPNQERPRSRNQYTDLRDRFTPMRGGILEQSENVREGEVPRRGSNIPVRFLTNGGNQRTFIGQAGNGTGNQTDPDGPQGRAIWRTQEGQQQLAKGSMFDPIMRRAKMAGMDIDHERESEMESEDGMLRKIIVGMYMERMAIKQGEDSHGYDPRAAMADINSTIWSTLKNVANKGGNITQDNPPSRASTTQIDVSRQRIGGGAIPVLSGFQRTFPQRTALPNSRQPPPTQGQTEIQNYQRRLLPETPGAVNPIPHMNTVFQSPSQRSPIPRPLNPFLGYNRAGDSESVQGQGQQKGQDEGQQPQWPQFPNQRNPPPQQVHNPQNSKVYNPLGVQRQQPYYPQNSHVYNPQGVNRQQPYIPQNPQKVYNQQGVQRQRPHYPQNSQVYNPQGINRHQPYNPQNPQEVYYDTRNPQQPYDPQVFIPYQGNNNQYTSTDTTSTTSTTTTPKPDNDQRQTNNDQMDLDDMLPKGSKILPSHIPKILDILQPPLVATPTRPKTMTPPPVIVATQIDGVRPGNNNEPARMVNIAVATEEIQTATDFLQQEVSTGKTIATESTSSVFGIIIACIIGLAVVVGPAVCIGCRVKQRAKERERKKAAAAATRNEESGIMEAIIMSELGRSALNRDENKFNGARPKSRTENGTTYELQALRSGRASPPIIVH